MENLLQSPATRGKKAFLSRTSSSGIFGTTPKILKPRETQVPQQSSISAALADAITPSSPDSKGTPNRKRNMEDRKTDSNRGVLPAPVESGEVKKLTAEIDEQKRVIAELTAQKDTLEHENSQQVFVRQMLIDSLKAEVSELKAQQQQGSEEQRIELERSAQKLRQELEEQRLKGEKQTSKMLALEAALTLADERMAALEKESASLRAACAKSEERELNYGAEIERLSKTNTSLAERVTNSETRHAETMVAMNEQIDALRRQFFFSTAISIKLGQFYQGRSLNISLTDLYERLMQLNLPFGDWPAWISEQILSATELPTAAPAAAAPGAAAKRPRMSKR